MKLIGFSGGYGSGKSTAIHLLTEFSDRPVVLSKFAQALYDIQNFAYERIKAVYTPPPGFVKDRKFLQWVGTEWGRGLDESLWIKLWQKEIEQLSVSSPGSLYVSDDCRFENEAALIRARGGVVIQIKRSNNAEHAVGGTGIANHASEISLPAHLVDAVIVNDGTLQDFKDSLSKLYQRLGVGQSEDVA